MGIAAHGSLTGVPEACHRGVTGVGLRLARLRLQQPPGALPAVLYGGGHSPKDVTDPGRPDQGLGRLVMKLNHFCTVSYATYAAAAGSSLSAYPPVNPLYVTSIELEGDYKGYRGVIQGVYRGMWRGRSWHLIAHHGTGSEFFPVVSPPAITMEEGQGWSCSWSVCSSGRIGQSERRFAKLNVLFCRCC
jgi:hypothetical protein